MLKVVEITKPDDWDEIYNIRFKFTEGEHDSKVCQSLITYDIETSNGWKQPDGTVLGFDHKKYNDIIDDKENPDYDEDYHNAIENGEPVSVLYVWQMAIEGDRPYVFMGRTWDEFNIFMEKLTTEIRRQAVYGFESISRLFESSYAQKAKNNVSCKIYIHNLGFEFQHLRNVYDFYHKKGRKGNSSNVFARSKRKPMKCHINTNHVRVEFRDTLVLTQKSLKSWCKDEKLPVAKLSEPKDYYLEMRLPTTTLRDDEILYSINDVVSMLYGLEKYRDKYETLNNIPLTQTGAVRKTCRARIAKENKDWAKRCHDITISYTPEEFKKLTKLFQGGWTHGNKHYIGKTVENVKCYDFASSYPAVMTTRTYPIGQFIKCDVTEFEDLERQDLNNPKYRWYMKIRLHDVVSKLDNSYWSLSKVALEEDTPIKSPMVDNGRIYACKEMCCYMTDLDWDTFKQCYSFKNPEVIELRKSESGYFPTEMIETILEYFEYKSSLKGLEDSESLYVESKQFINSIYGVFVTKIISEIVSFDDNGWDSKEPDDTSFYEMLQQTDEENSFTMYQAGVWVTAWARHNLFDFIIKLDKRIVYCDTDSIKGVFTDEDIKFVEEYNKNIEKLENDVAKKLGIDPSRYTATTSKGKIKRLGVMEREDDCELFKTLGAKRYVDLVNGEIECTIAGLPKSAGKAKIKSVDGFHDGLVWNTIESEKLIAHYNDNQSSCIWTDRDGNKWKSDDKYGICLQPTTFDLSMGKEFAEFLAVLRTGAFDRDKEDIFNQTPAYLLV